MTKKIKKKPSVSSSSSSVPPQPNAKAQLKENKKKANAQVHSTIEEINRESSKLESTRDIAQLKNKLQAIFNIEVTDKQIIQARKRCFETTVQLWRDFFETHKNELPGLEFLIWLVSILPFLRQMAEQIKSVFSENELEDFEHDIRQRASAYIEQTIVDSRHIILSSTTSSDSLIQNLVLVDSILLLAQQEDELSFIYKSTFLTLLDQAIEKHIEHICKSLEIGSLSLSDTIPHLNEIVFLLHKINSWDSKNHSINYKRAMEVLNDYLDHFAALCNQMKEPSTSDVIIQFLNGTHLPGKNSKNFLMGLVVISYVENKVNDVGLKQVLTQLKQSCFNSFSNIQRQIISSKQALTPEIPLEYQKYFNELYNASLCINRKGMTPTGPMAKELDDIFRSLQEGFMKNMRVYLDVINQGLSARRSNWNDDTVANLLDNFHMNYFKHPAGFMYTNSSFVALIQGNFLGFLLRTVSLLDKMTPKQLTFLSKTNLLKDHDSVQFPALFNDDLKNATLRLGQMVNIKLIQQLNLLKTDINNFLTNSINLSDATLQVLGSLFILSTFFKVQNKERPCPKQIEEIRDLKNNFVNYALSQLEKLTEQETIAFNSWAMLISHILLIELGLQLSDTPFFNRARIIRGSLLSKFIGFLNEKLHEASDNFLMKIVTELNKIRYLLSEVYVYVEFDLLAALMKTLYEVCFIGYIKFPAANNPMRQVQIGNEIDLLSKTLTKTLPEILKNSALRKRVSDNLEEISDYLNALPEFFDNQRIQFDEIKQNFFALPTNRKFPHERRASVALCENTFFHTDAKTELSHKRRLSVSSIPSSNPRLFCCYPVEPYFTPGFNEGVTETETLLLIIQGVWMIQQCCAENLTPEQQLKKNKIYMPIFEHIHQRMLEYLSLIIKANKLPHVDITILAGYILGTHDLILLTTGDKPSVDKMFACFQETYSRAIQDPQCSSEPSKLGDIIYAWLNCPVEVINSIRPVLNESDFRACCASFLEAYNQYLGTHSSAPMLN